MSGFSEYKIVIMGGGGVGKSALTAMYVCNNFVKEYDPTIEDSYRKQIVVDGRVALLDILDTAGQDEYSAMRDQYISFGRGFLLAYSITSRTSYGEVADIRTSILRAKDADSVPMVLCATKSDLEGERAVSREEGLCLASSFGCPFFESSAKKHVNVDETFDELVRVMRKEEEEEGEGEDGEGNGEGKKGRKKRKQHRILKRRRSKEQCCVL